MTSHRRQSLAALIILVQIAIPTALLVTRGEDSRPRAFGWQMFTAGTDRWAASVIHPDGSRHPVDVDALLLRPRAELQLDDALVNRLCDSAPDGARVEVQFGARTRTTPCS